MYRKILHLCNSEKTLAQGAFFDLMYVNQDTLDSRRQYAYLRHCDGEMTLVAANFGSEEVNTSIRIPQHALDCAQMAHGTYNCQNLLEGSSAEVNLSPDTMLPIHIGPHGAALYVIKQ